MGYERNDRLQMCYRLTLELWQKIYDFQEGLCPICKKSLEGRRPNTDHDHITGLIRGIPCFRCNRALGQFQDNPELLKAALEYVLDPPAVKALGYTHYGFPGRTRTKKQRKLAKKAKSLNLPLDKPVEL